MTRPQTRRFTRPVSLTPRQRASILSKAKMLPPVQHHTFVLRVEGKLSLRGTPYVSDALVAHIVDAILVELEGVS